MVRRIARGRGHRAQRRRFLGLGEQGEHSFERRRLASHLVGPAAKAGPEAGGARFFAGREETDILALRVSRGAGRSAIDAGGEHAGDEAAVQRPVAAQHRRPGLVVGDIAAIVHGFGSIA